jgi:hypothetical protein
MILWSPIGEDEVTEILFETTCRLGDYDFRVIFLNDNRIYCFFGTMPLAKYDCFLENPEEYHSLNVNEWAKKYYGVKLRNEHVAL